MPTDKKHKTIRVGLLVTASMVVLMVFLFFIGAEQKIFARKSEYNVQLENASGLAEGNPVRMSGVTIGVIKEIRLPQDPKEKNVAIQLMIDRKYSERIREDSRARLKKLGLLTGDSYIDVTPGTLRYEEIEPGSLIPAQRQTNVEQLISSGEDLVDNLVQISYSLKNVLGRVDRGEGLLGEMTSTPETKQRLTDTLLTTLNKTNAALAHIESGRGVMGKLIYDDAYGEQLTASTTGAMQSLQSVAANLQRSFDSGSGALPALLSDPEGKRRVMELVENLRLTSANLSTFSATLQSGEGLIPRLMTDKEYGDQAMAEFTLLVTQLNETVHKINTGEGTAGKIIADPSLYESVNDILIGINESRLLRWLIRNRQSTGIEKRYDERQKNEPAATPADVKSNVAPEVPPVPPVIPTTTTTESAVATTTSP
ncbi:MAG TPA: MlaD family protein [Thermoanaerobaculia bacterium]|nr:MlaD family protein [Thermoanaerobaculia bacterium]